jgi:hypothetical protein
MVCVLAFIGSVLNVPSPAEARHVAGTTFGRHFMTDGGYADGFFADWIVHSPYISPGGGFALTHLYWNFAQTNTTSNRNLLEGYPVRGAFAEVGVTVGQLDNTGYTGIQFYWQSCQNASSPSLCDLRFDYFESYMAPTPALIGGHEYRYLVQTGNHDGSWWWDLYIRDNTAGGNYIRGGGRASGAYSSTCCSNAAMWGAEANDDGFGTASISVPATGAIFYYHVPGGAFYNAWGPSGLWSGGAPAGYAGCRVDDGVTDYECGGGTREFSHRWTQKYWNGVVKSADVPG